MCSITRIAFTVEPMLLGIRRTEFLTPALTGTFGRADEARRARIIL
jgi:hypothetical protein